MNVNSAFEIATRCAKNIWIPSQNVFLTQGLSNVEIISMVTV